MSVALLIGVFGPYSAGPPSATMCAELPFLEVVRRGNPIVFEGRLRSADTFEPIDMENSRSDYIRTLEVWLERLRTHSERSRR